VTSVYSCVYLPLVSTRARRPQASNHDSSYILAVAQCEVGVHHGSYCKLVTNSTRGLFLFTQVRGSARATRQRRCHISDRQRNVCAFIPPRPPYSPPTAAHPPVRFARSLPRAHSHGASGRQMDKLCDFNLYELIIVINMNRFELICINI
jgi:hypothetical protein